jgi:PAS domain S-box-containing protein
MDDLRLLGNDAAHVESKELQRRKSQDALRAAKARFEGILAIANDAIISVDSNQRVLLFNQGAEKVFGYTQSEIIGESLDRLLPQRFASAHRKHLQEFAQSPDIARVMGQRREVFGVRKDGQEFPAEASVSKLDLGGELVFTVILRDITERKRAAEALRRSEHVARGQLDALAQTLNALAQESNPDRLLEHVLRTIVEQSGAHSVSAWERNDEGGYFDLIAVIEEGRFQAGQDATHPAARLPTLAQSLPTFNEILRTGEHGVLEDIDQPTARMCVGSGPDVVWHPALEDADPDAARTLLKKHLQELGVRAILFVPMVIAGRVTGFIGIRFEEKRAFQREEIELTRALAYQATLALQLMRLSQRSRHTAVVAERNRMAREIHDTLAQGFTGVIVQLEAAADASSKGLTKEAEVHVGQAGELASEGLQEARRSVRALRPHALENRNLCEALHELIRKMTAGTTMRAEFALEGEPQSLPTTWEENILRIAQEVLTNALRHAEASTFKAQLVFEPTEVRLELQDNGSGFDPTARHDGFGLMGIRERVEGMGGQLSIDSATGRGTAVLIALPFVRAALASS